MKHNTKANHSFPQCLIKQWIDNAEHAHPDTVWLCDKEYNVKEKGVGNIFYENNQYTQNTENLTSKDDESLSKYVKAIEAAERIDEKTKVFQDIRFLQLVYKLLCRTKAINNLFVNETYESLTFAKDLYTPGKVLPNGLTTDKLLKQTVNFYLLVEGNDDWAKMDYHFMVNRTNRRFILADNIKDKLILSLSPNLCVGFSLNKQNAGKIAVTTREIEDEDFIVRLKKNARRLRQIRRLLPKKRLGDGLGLASVEPRPEAGCQEIPYVRKKDVTVYLESQNMYIKIG